MGLKIRLILLSDLIGGEDLLAFATKQDVAIIISCAPYNEETTAQASSLVKLGVPVITLTDSNYSPLSSLATVRFNVLESSRGGVVRSTAGIALSEALAVCARETREAEGLISS